MDMQLRVLDIIDKYSLDSNTKAFRSQSRQMAALSAVAIFYAHRINWHPINTLPLKLRRELADVSQLLKIETTAHRTFIIHVRRLIHKLCISSVDKNEILRIREVQDGCMAVERLLEYLSSKNVFTAAHIRIWAMKHDLSPLDLTRKTGDAAKFRSNYYYNQGTSRQ